MTARCRTCGRTFEGYGKARYCSEQCRHGTDAGYAAGCRCAPCRHGHARVRNVLRMRPCPDVPVLGTRRRVEALACLGWSAAELSRRLGRDRTYLAKAFTATTIEPATALAVAELYERLSMTLATAPTAGRTATKAKENGWAPPLAWDCIDDPDEVPTVAGPDKDVVFDDLVVDRILDGDWRLSCTPADKTEVARRWHTQGRTLRTLQKLTGWRVERYFKASDAKAGEAA